MEDARVRGPLIRPKEAGPAIPAAAFFGCFRSSYPLSSESPTLIKKERVLMQRSHNLNRLVFLSLLSGLAFLMQVLNFPLPLFPTFLKADFSEIPALVGALVYGPLAGILVELLKNILHFLFAGSETGVIPLGQMANFLAGSVFVTVTVWIARRIEGVRGLVLGLAGGTAVMALLMTAANWYVIFPAYSSLLNMQVSKALMTTMILYGVAPFNVVKGILVSLLFVPLYLKLKPHLGRMPGLST
jgi:riboflavin transporter FmnP